AAQGAAINAEADRFGQCGGGVVIEIGRGAVDVHAAGGVDRAGAGDGESAGAHGEAVGVAGVEALKHQRGGGAVLGAAGDGAADKGADERGAVAVAGIGDGAAVVDGAGGA